MKLVEDITLANTLHLELWDASRAIAKDIVKVEVVIAVRVPLLAEYFDDPAHYELVKKVHGAELHFEYRKERTFVHLDDRERIFGELVSDFKQGSLRYIGHTEFPRRFALSRLREIMQNTYKYRHILQ